MRESALKIRTPSQVLDEQAQLLHEATRGVITGDVRTQQQGDRILVQFRVLVPSLNNYRLDLFYIRQSAGQYPATLVQEWGKRTTILCSDHEELETAVVDYLGTPAVQQIVAGLLAQTGRAAV